MLRSIIFLFLFTFTTPFFGQRCDCKGVIMPIQPPLNNVSISSAFASIFIQKESNGVPWYFHNKMIIEVPRMAIESFRTCDDKSFSTFYVTGTPIPGTLNTDIDGDYSIRMVDPFDASLSPSNVAVTYQKKSATIGGKAIYESDISINSFSPDYSNVADVVVLSPAGIIDGASVIRHELGHLVGIDHDPDTETLMFANLPPDEIRDIDCDLQEAYAQIYNCSISLNTSTCPQYKKPIEINLAHNYSIKKEGDFIKFTELDEEIKSITLFEKIGNYYKMLTHKQANCGEVDFKLPKQGEMYYQFTYVKDKSIPIKIIE